MRLRLPLLITALIAVAALLHAGPAAAQKKPMTFEEMDVEADEAKPAPKKEPPAKKAPPPPAQPAPEPEKTEAPPPQAEQRPVIDFSTPAPEQPAEKKAEFRGAISFDEIDVSLSSPDKDKMDKAIEQMKQGAFVQASTAFYEILANPKNLEFHQASEYNLAKSLYRMGKYRSSLFYFTQILNKGPSHKFFQSSLEWLFFISRKITNETTILDTIAKLAQYEFPPKYRDEFHLLLGKHFFLRNNTEDARKFIRRIADNSPFYPRARYLEGLTYYRNNRLEDALGCFRDVVRILHPVKGAFRDDMLREEAFLQLARVHYQAGQFKNSIFYYGKIGRNSENWLESLYESAWAHFRLDEQEKALGNLVTLHAPFFKDEYFPETLIIKAVIYYDNCRFGEANAFVTEFLQRYLPLFEEINNISTQKMSPDKYYEYLSNIQKSEGKAGDVKARVLNSALSDPDIKKFNDSIKEMDAELESFKKAPDSWRNSELARKLEGELNMQKRMLFAQAGSLTKTRLSQERDVLKELIANSYRIQLETQTKEKEVLEAKMRGEDIAARLLKKKQSVVTRDEEIYWPFEGEYWRDELGTFHYTMTRGCKPGVR
jgi:tetratricopeptide (TPR) repeat protein